MHSPKCAPDLCSEEVAYPRELKTAKSRAPALGVQHDPLEAFLVGRSRQCIRGAVG